MDLDQITPEIKHCKSIFSKALGLIFTRNNQNKSLVFHFSSPSYSPLHMFGVFYPIDVLFLDRAKNIIEIKENFRPFTFYSPKTKSSFIIEVSAGKIKEHNLKVSDKITF